MFTTIVGFFIILYSEFFADHVMVRLVLGYMFCVCLRLMSVTLVYNTGV